MDKYCYSAQERSALEHLRQPFAVYQFVDKRVVTLILSDGFCALFGYKDRAEAYFDMDNNMYKNDHPDDVARIANAALRFATEGGQYDVIYRTKVRGGSGYRIVHACGEHVYTDTGVRLAHVWYTDEGPYEEARDRQDMALNQSLSNALRENSIVKANQYDYLTGLPSMTYFFELSETFRQGVREAGGNPALMYLDFIGMKFFNARHGFVEGDRLLQAFAKLLAEAFGNERCCRISADHFVVVSEEAGLAQRLERVLRECQALNGGKTLPVHVGVYVAQFEKVHTSVACDRARLACKTLEGRYETAVSYYAQAMRENAVNRQYIIENIDRAIEEKWIQVYLQPIIRAVNERVCDVEALARWIDPEKGFLSPADFIPALEDAGLIYKLDLYMVDRILESMKAQSAAGFYIIPHSVNLSRSDFDACDIVEEIRARVDAAGVSRDRITIEITESVIGSDFDFMKEQVERFQALGFPVWMDDFGSGYSSLDVLQSIKFDLIKFDMSFMKKFDGGEASKVILTELMRLATALGVDTVCEGVETEAQVRFLREIGCSKLQGFYFSKPTPFETLKALRRDNALIPRENPEESEYYESIGRVNLFDLGVIGGEAANALHSVFDTIPAAILEIRDGEARYIRSNRAYQDFVKRFFDVDIEKTRLDFRKSVIEYGTAFFATLNQCCADGNRAFFDERTPDGSVVHAFVRRISVNPITGCAAVAIAVLSITERDDESTTYADIASALAADYYNIYLIDLDTNDYIEYSSQVGGEEMSLERHGEDFFESARRETMKRIYEEDRAPFLALFTKENVLRDIDRQGVFTTTYRLIDTGTPIYVNMKITRMRGGNRIILGVSNIDARMKQLEEEENLRQERTSLGRIAALSPDFIVLYTIDPVTGHYTQYNPSSEFASFGLARQGKDFFGDVVLDAPKAIAPEDMERHLRVLTRENMLREIRQKGDFVHHYRLMIDGMRVPVRLRATLVSESDGEKIILGVTYDESAEYRLKLAEVQKIKELNQTITDLLDNMPGLAFTKDAQTGVYLACNQNFAVYAHKAMPQCVVGLTDAQIFDAQTAAHFVEDDQKALAMGKPYMFFEDVPDAAGQQRQFQTTKFTFTDSTGRLCLQGMSQDVTELVRTQREQAATQAAYQRASDTAVIYTHLAHALARGCTDLYYVNMETEAFIEFHTDDARGVLTEARRGEDFFERCARDAELYVYSEDRPAFTRAMSHASLSKALDGNPVFEVTFRSIKGDRPSYVLAKVTRMEDDPRFIVISVSDIDELTRQRQAQKRVQEERLIYARLHALTGNFIVVYVVDPETSRYREFSATQNYEESFGREKTGEDFFASVRRDARVFAHPQDVDGFLTAFTKEKVLDEIKRNGIFTWGYRLMMEDRPVYVQMKAAMVEEKEGPRLIVGLNDVDAEYRQKEADREVARQKEIYDQITASLAEQYDTLYYVDIETNAYIEIFSTDEYKKLKVPTSGDDFFAESQRNIRRHVYPEDQEKALGMHSKDVMLGNLKNRTSFSMNWRLVVDGQVQHIRHTEIMARDGRHLIVCIKNVEAEVQAELALQADRKKRITYTQIAERLASHYDLIYYIDCANSNYAEFSTRQKSGELKIQSEGDNFFAAAQENAGRLIHSEDRERVRLFLDRDHLISQLENRRQLTEDYRLIVGDGKTQYTRMSVTYSSDHGHFIVCVENRDEDVRREKEHLAELSLANEMARRDELTHTKNKTAYREMEKELQARIEAGGGDPFGIVVCDINGLKHINDTQGHKAGDDYIKASCKLICKVFQHSPVFRVGGDEFVVLLWGEEFENRTSLLSGLKRQVEENIHLGEGPIVASGLAEYQPHADRSVEAVFNRADSRMYEDKTRLKEQKLLQESLFLKEKAHFKAIPEDRRVYLDAMFKAFEIVSEGNYVFLCDMKYDFSRWSGTAVEAFGLPSEYMYGAGDIWENQIHPEDRAAYHKGIDEIFTGNASGHDMQYRARRTTGEYDVCTCRGFVLRDRNGKPDYFAGAIRNHGVCHP